MKKIMFFCIIFILLVSCSMAEMQQIRQKNNLLDAEINNLRVEQRNVPFGSALYSDINNCIRALQRERTALTNLERSFRFGNEGRIQRSKNDYNTARQRSLSAKEKLGRSRIGDMKFGSPEWHYQRGLNQHYRYGQNNQRGIHSKIKILEVRRNLTRFGSSEWRAIERELRALRELSSRR